MKYREGSMVTLFLLAFLLNLSAQTTVFMKKWPEKQWKTADSVSHLVRLGSDERHILLLLNLARMNGPLFAQTFLEYFIDSVKYERNSFLESLILQLSQLSPLPIIVPDSELTAIARSHAHTMGENGQVGHNDFDRRYESPLSKGKMVAENCFYGPAKALIIVSELLIDNGIADLGHRRNILDPQFNQIGIAIAPHTGYGTNCVMSFASDPSHFILPPSDE